ncbi:hypothetical protein [Paenibacillus radicis (ex Gao et al. 2016)]|uniref:Uncharacterized protein n=1 Tax=Paenibacillus radicis (ex Gao et al. 2016) TaxID=1737354 RepID=A0A917HGN4_9BACL|nr:hypothetical protein [Paenibacillus radicis (ex Gao et al. 2016)]GGG78004.1 hypothetical protein GCM10010918_38530 [Paenibacillus radicis (ex Gao et al. 2016)]
MRYTYKYINTLDGSVVKDCGCGGPRMLSPGGPAMGMPPLGQGMLPQGPGAGQFVPGPGGGFPAGHGHFPPGHGQFPPGHGHFPPGPGPFPPGPFPFPFPLPVPFPVPGPFPVGSVNVWINGGSFFPNVTQGYRIPYRPGLSIFQALSATGVVQFSFNGQIESVSGIPIGGPIGYILRLNGRIIPTTLLNFPLQLNDSVTLELQYAPSGRPDDEELADISDVSLSSVKKKKGNQAVYDEVEIGTDEL